MRLLQDNLVAAQARMKQQADEPRKYGIKHTSIDIKYSTINYN
jgi:hypothetical protein